MVPAESLQLDAAELVTQDPHGAGRWKGDRTAEGEDRALACPVWPEHHPVLAAFDGEGYPVQDFLVLATESDPFQFQSRG